MNAKGGCVKIDTSSYFYMWKMFTVLYRTTITFLYFACQLNKHHITLQLFHKFWQALTMKMNIDISKVYLQILDFAERYPFVKIGLVCLTFVLIYNSSNSR